jgi:hypothetical protein
VLPLLGLGRSNTDYRLSLGCRTHATRELSKACEEAVMHCKFNPKKNKNLKDIQVGFILNKMGSTDRIVFKVVLIMQYMMQQEIA